MAQTQLGNQANPRRSGPGIFGKVALGLVAIAVLSGFGYGGYKVLRKAGVIKEIERKISGDSSPDSSTSGQDGAGNVANPQENNGPYLPIAAPTPDPELVAQLTPLAINLIAAKYKVDLENGVLKTISFGRKGQETKCNVTEINLTNVYPDGADIKINIQKPPEENVLGIRFQLTNREIVYTSTDYAQAGEKPQEKNSQ